MLHCHDGVLISRVSLITAVMAMPRVGFLVTGPSTSSGEGSGQQVGRQGRALLLHHVAHVLQLDLAARLRVWRAARQQDDGGARAAETVLQSALLWRLLQVGMPVLHFSKTACPGWFL